MSNEFNHFFQYLEKEEISIDKSEFLFQIQSHPDYPSLLSVADTLNFLNIENGALKIIMSEIDLLPNRFIALLNEKHQVPLLYFLEKKRDCFVQYKDGNKTILTKTELEQQWNDVVLLVEKTEKDKKNIRNNYSFIFSILWFSFSIILLIIFQNSYQSNLFFIFPVFGIVFSVAALKDLFGTKSELLNDFCNISTTTSCSTIIGSDKWKIFKYLNFSDLSIVFFAFQIIGLFLFVLLGQAGSFLFIQKILSITSIPVIILSIYFQKYIENKWCPICLVIITLIFLEIGYLIVFENENTLSKWTILLCFFIFFSIYTIWVRLKKVLLDLKDLKEFQLKGNRFIRNYTIFKQNLIKSEKFEFPYYSAILGNKDSQTEIAIITNPFCGYCKDADGLLNKILKANNNLKIKIIMNVDLENEDEKKSKLFRSLLAIYLESGVLEFNKALTEWFEQKDINIWLKKYGTINNVMKIDEIYFKQNQWCKSNNFHTTPLIFINGYKYPKIYDRDNLEYFINELIEDNF